MIVKGYYILASQTEWLPVIPIGIVIGDEVFGREGSPLPPQPGYISILLKTPVETSSSDWIGVDQNNVGVVLTPIDEPQWRVAQATAAIEESKSPATADPIAVIRKVNAIHAAAGLLGLRVPELFGAIAKARKSPDEPLEVTVRTLASDLAKHK